MPNQSTTRRTLVYKRTHDCGEGEIDNDPCASGCFGCWDCMGRVRDFHFQAVIGIGGIGNEAEKNQIAGKLNWIGIGPHTAPAPKGYRGKLLTFDRFRSFGINGPLVCDVAPDLAAWMYTIHRRYSLTYPERVWKQVEHLLTLAARSKPSPSLGQPRQRRSGCRVAH